MHTSHKDPTSRELLNLAVEAARSAGEILCHGFGTAFKISSKEGVQNLVTEYDEAAEKSIIALITKAYPDHKILAEESGKSNASASPYTWIIDPLDGTVNFAHGVPLFTVSIAVAKGNDLLAGVILHPLYNRLFTAEKGQGAQLDGAPIHVSKIQDPYRALLATGFPYDLHTNPLRTLDDFAKIQGKGIPVRRLGSAALDLAYVACGRFDGYWEVSVNPWDMAAGMLLVQEAGGKVTHYDGSPHKIFSQESIVATNGALHPFLLEQLK